MAAEEEADDEHDVAAGCDDTVRLTETDVPRETEMLVTTAVGVDVVLVILAEKALASSAQDDAATLGAQVKSDDSSAASASNTSTNQAKTKDHKVTMGRTAIVQ